MNRRRQRILVLAVAAFVLVLAGVLVTAGLLALRNASGSDNDVTVQLRWTELASGSSTVRFELMVTNHDDTMRTVQIDVACVDGADTEIGGGTFVIREVPPGEQKGSNEVMPIEPASEFTCGIPRVQDFPADRPMGLGRRTY